MIRRQVWDVDPEAAIPVIEMLDTQLVQSVAPETLQSIVLSSFGIAALALAILGVYGVLAYSVSLRTPEFGIRVALGSGKGALIGLVLLQAAYPVALGTGAGLIMALIALRWVRSLLYQTPVMDPLAVGGSVLLLLVAATLAAIVPARRGIYRPNARTEDGIGVEDRLDAHSAQRLAARLHRNSIPILIYAKSSMHSSNNPALGIRISRSGRVTANPLIEAAFWTVNRPPGRYPKRVL